ncbi:MAG: hypothetical protein AAGA92_12855 [Planctomycetota bacterium]
MESHITVLSIIYIGLGLLGLIPAVLVLVAIVGGGLISGDPRAISVTSIVGPIIAGLIGIWSVPAIIGGIGLYKRFGWARILVLILGVFELIGFPIGTAIGVYTLWALTRDEAAVYFD